MGKKKIDKLEKENKKNFITFVIVLLITFGGLATYFVFKGLNEPSDYKNSIKSILSNKTIETVEEKAEKEEAKKELESIIENELYVLNDKKNISELTNQDKLHLALKKMSEKEDIKNDISASKLDAYYKETCLSLFKYTDENIKDSKVELEYDDNNGYEYSSNVYKYNSVSNIQSVGIAAKEMESFTKEKDKYIVTYKYLFNPISINSFKTTSIKELENSSGCYYKTYNDARYTIESNCISVTSYKKIKDELDTYVYTFEKKDDSFVLVDFNRK